MKQEVKRFSIEYAGKKLEAEIGRLAGQADGSVFIKYGDTSILVTAVMSKDPKDANYLPLIVDYEERYYAAGKIKGSRWIKRETRPGEEAILHARMIDRTLRPRFDQRIRNDIQVVATVLSFDEENDPDIPALIGASLALMISDIPFGGPVAGARVGEIDGKLVLNPSYEERTKSSFDLMVAGIDEKVNMIELKANIVSEDRILKAIEIGHKEYRKIIDFQNKIIDELKPKKRAVEVFEPDEKIKKEIKNFLAGKLENALYPVRGREGSKTETKQALGQVKESLYQFIKEKFSDHPDLGKVLKELENIFGLEMDEVVHRNVLENEKR